MIKNKIMEIRVKNPNYIKKTAPNLLFKILHFNLSRLRILSQVKQFGIALRRHFITIFFCFIAHEEAY